MSNAYSTKNRRFGPHSRKSSLNNTGAMQVSRRVSPRQILEAAKTERQTVENRIRYLASEQEKYQKKIEKAKVDLEKRNQIQAPKLDNLKTKI